MDGRRFLHSDLPGRLPVAPRHNLPGARFRGGCRGASIRQPKSGCCVRETARWNIVHICAADHGASERSSASRPASAHHGRAASSFGHERRSAARASPARGSFDPLGSCAALLRAPTVIRASPAPVPALPATVHPCGKRGLSGLARHCARDSTAVESLAQLIARCWRNIRPGLKRHCVRATRSRASCRFFDAPGHG